ncbi:MAG TPA: hypothetical protein VMG39_02245 [Pseudolabrys sp.]|nr:hypothetical protein [Pseudolabrys sp.]
MLSQQRRKTTPFWTQDILVTALVVTYLALACGVAQVWTVLSHQADAFAAESRTLHGR